MSEQAIRLLVALSHKNKRPGQIIRVNYADPELQSLAWAVDNEELYFIAASYLLNEKHYLSVHSSISIDVHSPLVRVIAPAGWAFLQERGGRESHSGFIAMWFDESTVELRERGLKPSVEAAGYRSFLVNESLQNKPIDAEIIANIRRSRFLIADLHSGDSGARGSVYFEAGYAMGHGIPVFWTCHQDDLDRQRIPFDVRQYVLTAWGREAWDVFVQRLSSLIEANEGAGPFKRI